MNILAIDLGKFNSMACYHLVQRSIFHFKTTHKPDLACIAVLFAVFLLAFELLEVDTNQF